MYNSPMFSGRGLAEGAREAAGIVARGFCMGAADLVPGVSGGTVAFIAGIYARLLAALGALSSPPLWRALMGLQIRQVWQAADGGFLAALFFGILTAALTLANLLRYLLATHTHLLLAFFSGWWLRRRLRSPAKCARQKKSIGWRRRRAQCWGWRRCCLRRQHCRRLRWRFFLAGRLQFARCCCRGFPEVIFC